MNLQQKLSIAIENFQSLELAKNHFEKLNTRLAEAYVCLERLHLILQKEFEDVQALEKLTVNGLFRKILGDKEAQLEKERQEYLHAVLKYNEFLKTVELLEYEQILLQKKVKDYNIAKSTYHSLIRQREKELLQTNEEARMRLQIMDQQMDAKLKMKREIHEALTVGIKATEILRQMENLLEKATEWGNWQSSYSPPGEKYGLHVDQATKLSYQAKQLLQQFEDELKDIYEDQRIYISYNLESFKHFNNFFFDDLISDWIVQRKIKNALYNVQSVKDKVIMISTSLKQELKQTAQAIEYIQDRKEKIVLDLNGQV